MAAHVDDGIARWASPFVRNVRQTIIIYSDVFHARFQATALIQTGFLDLFSSILIFFSYKDTKLKKRA